MGKMYFIVDFCRKVMTPGSMSMSTAALVREFATYTLWKRLLILQIAKKDLKKLFYFAAGGRVFVILGLVFNEILTGQVF